MTLEFNYSGNSDLLNVYNMLIPIHTRRDEIFIAIINTTLKNKIQILKFINSVKTQLQQC